MRRSVCDYALTFAGALLRLLAIIVLALTAAVAVPLEAQTYTVLHSFGSGADGANPGGLNTSSAVIHGVTANGGADEDGTFFDFNTVNGDYSVIASFNGTDGMHPSSSPEGGPAILYGSTPEGGTGTIAGGTIYRYDDIGPTFGTVYNFCSEPNCVDGRDPSSGLASGGGKLYGTTSLGGAYNLGTVYAADAANGTESVLHSFAGGADGAIPGGTPVLYPYGSGTEMYGVTNQGGTHNLGTVFQVNRSTGAESVLHSFGGTGDGQYPAGGLLLYVETLYGTTENGGSHGYGTIFSITATGEETVLYSFTGGADGANPGGNLIQDSAYNFYGTATYGGNSHGTLWRLSPSGVFTVLHTFCTSSGCPDGAYPGALSFEPGAKAFAGTASGGGAYGGGVLFQYTLP